MNLILMLFIFKKSFSYSILIKQQEKISSDQIKHTGALDHLLSDESRLGMIQNQLNAAIPEMLLA